MYCKYCGRGNMANASVCGKCRRILTGSIGQRSSKPFYFVLLLGPILGMLYSTLYNALIGYELIQRSPDAFSSWRESILFDNLTNLHNQSLIYIVLIFILVKRKKIDTTCCKMEDIIVWSGGTIINVLVPMDIIIFNTTNLSDIYVTSSISMFLHVQRIFTMPGMWNYFCLIVFLLIRSENVKMRKKAVIIIASILIIWSLLLVLFAGSLIMLFHVDSTVFDLTKSMFIYDALFMWFRHLILLWFAILLGRKEMGFVGGVTCLAGFSMIPFVADYLFLRGGIFIGYGLAQTIGYVFIGIVLLVAKLLHVRQSIGVNIS